MNYQTKICQICELKDLSPQSRSVVANISVRHRAYSIVKNYVHSHQKSKKTEMSMSVFNEGIPTMERWNLRTICI